MDRIAMLFFAGLGSICIYAGYKLFCGLPLLNGQTSSPSRKAVLLMNVVPGAVLALVGTGILTTEARSLTSHRPTVQRHEPAAQGAQWHRRKSGFLARAA
jgi:hypothetical protein